MYKVKKLIGLDKESYDLIKKKQDDIRKSGFYSDNRRVSSLFDEAILLFSKKKHAEFKLNNGKIVKRQTVYISEKANGIYNKLAFECGITLQQAANLIVKAAYS